MRRWLCLLSVLLGLLPAPALAATPGTILNPAMVRTWNRTDLPVAEGRVSRTWMWGTAIEVQPVEAYVQAEGGQRQVYYFDKGRMEITHPIGDQTSPWYVTAGLLAKEMVTGEEQVGDDQFVPLAPARINVAGDLDDPTGPTYATFHALLGYQPVPLDWTLIQTVDRAGHIGTDPALAAYGVTAATLVPQTNHTVASVFWEFMNSSGLVYEDGQYVTDRLFPNPFYATGYPLTEAYWSTVRVGGVAKRVLIQVFERRVLTYTPDNPAGWQVEAGNVGRHYYLWRYGRPLPQ